MAKRLNEMGLLYYLQGKFAEVEPLFKRAQAIHEKVYGPEHPKIAIDLDFLAGLYCGQGKYAEAESLYVRSLAIREKAFGPDHPDMAQLYRMTDRKRLSGEFEKRADAIRKIRR